MVNTLSHLGIGLLIASVAGLNSRQVKIVAFMAILPDLDFIANVLLLAIDQNLSHQTYNIFYYLLAHREFMHSVIFVFLMTFYVWYREKNKILTFASGVAIFSHIYLDYVTSWKMRPFFPFVKEASTIGAIDFFDPVVTIISFVPIFYILAEHAKNNRINRNKKNSPENRKNGKDNTSYSIQNIIFSKVGKITGILKNSNNWFAGVSEGKHRSLYRNLLIIFTLWCILNPFTKAMLIGSVEESEGYNISYQDSYPISPGKFLSAYQYNDTHYRILTSDYWSGIEKAAFIPIYPDDKDEFSGYLTRAKDLYYSSLPGEIDYIVYNVSTSRENVTVILSDARNPFAEYWAYFKVEYIFVFDVDSENYEVYLKRNDRYSNKLPINYFE